MTVVKVRLFAALRELAGSNEVEADGASVGELVEALSRRYGERFEKIARAGSVVVDGERAGPGPSSPVDPRRSPCSLPSRAAEPGNGLPALLSY